MLYCLSFLSCNRDLNLTGNLCIREKQLAAFAAKPSMNERVPIRPSFLDLKMQLAAAAVKAHDATALSNLAWNPVAGSPQMLTVLAQIGSAAFPTLLRCQLCAFEGLTCC